VIALIPTGAAITLTIAILVLIRRLTRANYGMKTTTIKLTQANAKADAARQQAEQVAGLAKDAVAQTGEALHVARQIDKVSDQMDVLMEHVAADQPELPGHGKHARPDLHAVPGERDIA